ncbi:MAG: hypothetical protein AB8G23_09005 [Myxococcota bacterium]
MKFKARLTVFSTLLAFSASGAASAESQVTTSTFNSSAIEDTTNAQLDAAVEHFSAQQSVEFAGLSGPTSMECAISPEGSLETCTVRLIGSTLPAALAHN